MKKKNLNNGISTLTVLIIVLVLLGIYFVSTNFFQGSKNKGPETPLSIPEAQQ